MNFKFVFLFIACATLLSIGCYSEVSPFEKEASNEWCLIVSDGKKATSNEFADMKLVINAIDSHKVICVMGSDSDPWILVKGSASEATKVVAAIARQPGFKMVYFGVVEGIGLDVIKDRWLPAMALAELDDSYKLKISAAFIAVKTDSGIVFVGKRDKYELLKKYTARQK